MTLQEIQNRLSSIKAAGYIPSVRKGPTGIGHTLEQQLGLTENNFPTPDIGGHTELKATRKKSQKTNSLITLFTFNRAAWQIHPSQVIEDYGFVDVYGRPALWSTVYCKKQSPHGLKVELSQSNDRVDLVHVSGARLATWSIDAIVKQFISKLERLLVVLADNRQNKVSGVEEFWFNEAYLHENPSSNKFLTAFANSQIAIDVRMYLKSTGAVRNHGTGFRIKENDIVNLYASKQKIL